MASFQARKRDPLFDSATQAVIERRGRELFGMALGLVGLLFAAMIYSYVPDDPSWMSATDAPVQNWLGRFGATTSATLMMIVGKAVWVLPIMLIVWGVRFALHIGAERAITRVIFAPIALAIAAIYAATLTPGDMWTANFGLGGLLGDTALAVVLELLPLGVTFLVKTVSFFTAIGCVALMMFVLGFVRSELHSLMRFALIGTIIVYATLVRSFSKGASAAAQKAQGFGQSVLEKKTAAPQQPVFIAENPVHLPPSAEKARAAAVVRANPVMPTRPSELPNIDGRKMPPMNLNKSFGAAPTAAQAMEPPVSAEHFATSPAPQQSGFLAGLLKRNDPMPEPELVTPTPISAQVETSDDRVTARISDAIKNRTRGLITKPMRIEQPASPAPSPLPQALQNLPPQPIMKETPNLFVEPVLEDMPIDAAMPDYAQATIAVQSDPLPHPQADLQAGRVVIPTPAPKKVVQHPLKRATMPSKQALAEAQPKLKFEDRYADYETPPLSLLTSPDTIERHHLSDEALEENARMLESVLDDYGVKGEIVSVRPGPVVTMYELEPAPGLKASRVIGLSDDIARSMSALSARVSTVPGRSVIGIELPNEKREMVILREMLSARDFGDSNMKLPLALGKDIGGEPIIANLAKMPHLLIAGTTGSGKSVAINTMILSLLYKLSPEECRMIMIDPKMLELSVYDGIPHLLSPVVTDPKKAVVALKWVVGEMEERYRKMSKMGVRNIDGYNGRVRDALAKDEMFSRTVQTGFDDETGEPVFETEEFLPEVLPYIVVVVDEMADLMMVAGKEIEACIQRLAQMARASGIHLIMATQRPSVDVITGTIKANFPTRISFQVTSKIDSRTILGEMGAEQLLGMGDMLYMAGGGKISRIHGPFCSDEEVEEIVNHLKAFGPPEYMSGVVDGPSEDKESDIDLVLGLGGNTDGENALYDQAVAIVIKDRKCSTSYIQRKLAIGYNKAARLVEQMEDEGVVSSANHVGKREVLVPEQH
jgi:S-DNA-T family DNA segregation ATPase FtsK/SpoIIIE